MVQLINPVETYHVEDGHLYRQRTQEVPDWYITELREKRNEFEIDLDGFTPAAEVPVEIINRWLAAGFNAYEAPLSEILFRLKLEGYDDLIICKDTTFAR